MTKVDIASMAHGLECRQPFLDYRLVEFAASLPASLKFRWGGGKRLLRRTFERLLPRQIWTRKKMGFGVPLGSWFQNELRELTRERLLSTESRCHQFLRPEAISGTRRSTHDRQSESQLSNVEPADPRIVASSLAVVTAGVCRN